MDLCSKRCYVSISLAEIKLQNSLPRLKQHTGSQRYKYVHFPNALMHWAKQIAWYKIGQWISGNIIQFDLICAHAYEKIPQNAILVEYKACFYVVNAVFSSLDLNEPITGQKC